MNSHQFCYSCLIEVKLALRSHDLCRGNTMTTVDSHKVQNTDRPWHLVLLLPESQHHILTKFRNRRDAEDQLRAIRRLLPNAVFEVMFCPPRQEV